MDELKFQLQLLWVMLLALLKFLAVCALAFGIIAAGGLSGDGTLFLIAFFIAIVIILGAAYGPSPSSSRVEPYAPLMSTCLRCGNLGFRTAHDGRRAGYRCDQCKRFWTERIH